MNFKSYVLEKIEFGLKLDPAQKIDWENSGEIVKFVKVNSTNCIKIAESK